VSCLSEWFAKSTSRLNVKVLIVVVLVASISLYLFMGENGSATETAKTRFCASSGLASASLMSTSTLSSNDTNWAGYIVASDLQNPQASVTNVSASWTVPTVTVSSQDTFSAVWIGIGGFFDNSLIQTGTEQDSVQGQSEYSAWVEMLPQNSITIDTIAVSPGDQITASIQLVDANTDQWSVYLKDVTNNQEFTDSYFYASSRLSAEWIVERPDVSSPRSRGTLTSLADVGTVEFAGCQATVGGVTGTISSFSAVKSVMYETVQSTSDSGSMLLATVSGLSAEGSGFSVETSPSAIPELSVLMLIPLIIGIGILATIIRKRVRFRN
jgi:hypothetical protein